MGEKQRRRETPDLLGNGPMEKVRSMVKREDKVIMGYFWISFTYQMMVYALMSHLIVRDWAPARMTRGD